MTPCRVFLYEGTLIGDKGMLALSTALVGEPERARGRPAPQEAAGESKQTPGKPEPPRKTLTFLPPVSTLTLAACDLGPKSAGNIMRVLKVLRIRRDDELWHSSLRGDLSRTSSTVMGLRPSNVDDSVLRAVTQSGLVVLDLSNNVLGDPFAAELGAFLVADKWYGLR